MSVLAAGGARARRRGSAQRPRVIVVDDDPVLRRQLRGLLEDLGIEVVADAADGGAGVEAVVRLRPDVALLDLRMPGMDGLDAARAIREHAPGVQVLMLTAYDDPGLDREARAAGVYAYLVKGCSPMLIRDVVGFAAEHGRSSAER